MKSLLQTETDRAVEAALDALCLTIQQAHGIETGDVAAQWASDPEVRGVLAGLVTSYYQFEEAWSGDTFAPPPPTKMTFEQFQATGEDCADLGAALDDECLAGRPGRLYDGGCLWIEDGSDWPETAPGFGRGRWYTILTNDQCQSDDLAKVERALYGFAVDEGYAEESGDV